MSVYIDNCRKFIFDFDVTLHQYVDMPFKF